MHAKGLSLPIHSIPCDKMNFYFLQFRLLTEDIHIIKFVAEGIYTSKSSVDADLHELKICITRGATNIRDYRFLPLLIRSD